ncbi:MAG TPA: AtpZ/AtpI family protein [Caulobacteraceae bacterium]|jgi:ATP synthase protein I|nr:AtpZ/AtpI family protein [Caulobacteraceae bacterium]
MPEPDNTSREALRRLDDKLAAFEAKRETHPTPLGISGSSGEGFRMLGQILGGVLGGLGLGWLVDHLAGTSPWGVLAGLLTGSALSIVAAVRQATAMGAKAGPISPEVGGEDVPSRTDSPPQGEE